MSTVFTVQLVDRVISREVPDYQDQLGYRDCLSLLMSAARLQPTDVARVYITGILEVDGIPERTVTAKLRRDPEAEAGFTVLSLNTEILGVSVNNGPKKLKQRM